MARKSIDLHEPGRDARVAAEAQAKREEAEAALKRQLASEACVDCGAFGPWSDGKFHYCEKHVSRERYHADASFRARAEKSDAGNFKDALQQFYKRYGNPHADS